MAEPTIKFLGFVQAGFPSPASDYSEEDINLEKILKPKSSGKFADIDHHFSFESDHSFSLDIDHPFSLQTDHP